MATKKVEKSKINKGSNLDKLREAFSNSGGGNVRWWQPEWGDNVIRILPPIDPDGLFFLETARHRVDGYWFECLHYQIDEDTGKPKNCPICDARKRLFKSGDKTLIEVAKAIKGKLQYLMNIIQRKGDEPTAVKIWGAGVKIWKKMMKDMLDDELDITDVDKGYDFQVTKEEGPKTDKGTFPNYDTSKIKRKSSALNEDEKVIDQILDNRIVLESVHKFEAEEVLQSAIDSYIESLTDTSKNKEFYEEKSDTEVPVETEKTTKTSKTKLDDFKRKLNEKMND